MLFEIENEIKNQIISSFNKLKDSEVDKELFVRYLLINILLNMDNYETDLGGSEIDGSVDGYEQEKSELAQDDLSGLEAEADPLSL